MHTFPGRPVPESAPSLLRAVPKASTWRERTRCFAHFVAFTAQSANAASSSVTMATVLRGTAACHGKAVAGPAVPACAVLRFPPNFLEETHGNLFSLCAWLPPVL